MEDKVKKLLDKQVTEVYCPNGVIQLYDSVTPDRFGYFGFRVTPEHTNLWAAWHDLDFKTFVETHNLYRSGVYETRLTILTPSPFRIPDEIRGELMWHDLTLSLRDNSGPIFVNYRTGVSQFAKSGISHAISGLLTSQPLKDVKDYLDDRLNKPPYI